MNRMSTIWLFAQRSSSILINERVVWYAQAIYLLYIHTEFDLPWNCTCKQCTLLETFVTLLMWIQWNMNKFWIYIFNWLEIYYLYGNCFFILGKWHCIYKYAIFYFHAMRITHRKTVLFSFSLSLFHLFLLRFSLEF